ncbi:aldo/keto reductase [Sphingobacterium hungaricum]|uniref:L-fucose dehydrogenase n=1 Tax=Sphingobacterium hungaricum TaxID=2082723 RepID=A0A928UV70_9SPHI|nr:aldo/keto reductase [Sphingobacterium hungaricum]MBE8712161.1 L-fucose dehydrogenase [Sphingobacterium hungaricum]
MSGKINRRNFIAQSGMATAGIALSPLMQSFANTATKPQQMNTFENAQTHSRFRPKHKAGFGGVAIGNGFNVNPDIECLQSLEAAWDAGVRYFDTSPWYGLGISERRMGTFLRNKNREEFTLSTKVGRILKPHENFKPTQAIWEGKLEFSYEYDYSAAGVRKSVEDSINRLGVSSIDIVFIHDLSPDNGDMKEDWVKYFEIAQKGAMPELTKMREEGLIKAWGFGVNTIEPILKTIEVADPDIFLSATQYSIIKHEDDLNLVFPKCAERDISIVVGAPLNAGFLAGKNRYDYGGEFPAGVKEKLAAIELIAKRHQVDVRTAALQFAAAPEVVSAVIPGAHTVQQAKENAKSLLEDKIPSGFWTELKEQKLILEHAPVPSA